MEENFSKNLIKDYQYWSVYIYENQGYLGRCTIWCKRENALDLSDATEPEQKELFIILQELKNAALECFHPDWFNYAFLGNATRHLHGHFVPRYAEPKTFCGKVFEDTLYGDNFETDDSFVTSEEVLRQVQSVLAKALK